MNSGNPKYHDPINKLDAICQQHDKAYSQAGNDLSKKQLADELHKPIKRKFNWQRVISNHIDAIWAADLVEMQQFSKWNKGYKYLLMVRRGLIFHEPLWGKNR